MLDAIAALVPAMQARAAVLDAEGRFPDEDVADLRAAGLLTVEPGNTDLVLPALRLVGRGNLSTGRVIEAHINAMLLIATYGTAQHRSQAQADAKAGHLFALWVTDHGPPVTLLDGRLTGIKAPGSAAGHATRAVITADTPGGTRLATLALDAIPVQPMPGLLPGMRASITGAALLDGIPLDPAALFGAPGDYLREPLLSTGAWRTSAVTLGGLDALVEAARTTIVIKGHAAHVLQQERFGRIAIAHDTAALWAERAARHGDDPSRTTAERVTTVGLARIAIETACLDVMHHVQRGLGLGAFIRPGTVERLMRDLAVYLRQPAPDAVLTEAGLYRLQTPG